MLTPAQEKWLNHLSDTKTVKIVPFDPTCEEKVAKVREKIQKYLGENILVEHSGASALGISGQDEIDVYIPVSQDDFEKYVALIGGLFGEPRSLYAHERARFGTVEEGKHVDVFVINKEHDDWKNSLKFHEYLRLHKDALEEYKKLKEGLDGKSVREYYHKKILFINDILEKARVARRSV